MCRRRCVEHIQERGSLYSREPLCRSAVLHSAAALVKRRVAGVEILAVEMVLRDAQGIAEAVKMK